MKDLVTIEKGVYNSLLKQKETIDKQIKTISKLREDNRILERRLYELLINDEDTVNKLLSLGDYEGLDTHV